MSDSIEREIYLGPLSACFCIIGMGYLIFQFIIAMMGAQAQDVHLIRKYDQCFVAYHKDIEVIPCPK